MKISFGNNSDINFYFSFQCPYSYIVWKHLLSVLKDNDKITVNPINIGITPPSNNSFSFREFWGKERWERISKEADALGIVINNPSEIVSEDLAARCIQCYEEGSVEYYINSVFKAVFQNKIDISITNTLRYFLQSEGNDSEILIKASKDSETLEKYKEQTELWSKKRIRVLPTIEVDNERIAGFITKRPIENIIHTILD